VDTIKQDVQTMHIFTKKKFNVKNYTEVGDLGLLLFQVLSGVTVLMKHFSYKTSPFPYSAKIKLECLTLHIHHIQAMIINCDLSHI
jgi:hypothetical protein